MYEQPAENPTKSSETSDSDILELALERFKEANDAEREDFESCKVAQEFIAGKHWPDTLRAEREASSRPCLTIDHLNQFVRHVVNSGLLRERDVKVLSMDGDGDDEVADILAGIIRQVTQSSTAKVAYETGLRHGVSNGFGYWRVIVQGITGAPGQFEIAIKKIKEPRMVLFDPFCDYPDGRDAQYCFVFKKLARREFDKQYPDAGECQSWHSVHEGSILPNMAKGSMVIAEYYYYDDDGALRWAICTPDKILDEDLHHGSVIPIIRVVGEEFELDGKCRKRGMINQSSMDAQRAYDYACSSFIENVALAPLAPWIVAEGQIDQYKTEWAEAHRVPRPYLRYKPTTQQGQPVPPPQRAQPAGIPEGWQGMMQNLIQDTQMIMGVAQPNVLGTGGIPVQSGIGVQAQQEPGDVNTFHYIDHWISSIEQTGRVILAMIPHVYTTEQVVKIVGADGKLETARLNPNLPQPVLQELGKTMMGVEKVLSKSYNHMIGRYDSVISTGPSSAARKSEAHEFMKAMVYADPSVMQKAGDLIAKTSGVSGADELAKRLRAFLPPGVAEDDEAVVIQQLQQFAQQNQILQQQVQEMEKIILAEREKAQSELIKADMKRQGDVAKVAHEWQMKLMEKDMSHEGALQLAEIKAHVDLVKNERDNIVKLVLGQLQNDQQEAQRIQQYEQALEQVDDGQTKEGEHV